MDHEIIKFLVTGGAAAALATIITRLYSTKKTAATELDLAERADLGNYRRELHEELRQLRLDYRTVERDIAKLQLDYVAKDKLLGMAENELKLQKIFSIEQDEEIVLKTAEIVRLRRSGCPMRRQDCPLQPDHEHDSLSGPSTSGGIIL